MKSDKILRNLGMVSALAGVLALTSACGSTVGENSPAPAGSPNSISQTESPVITAPVPGESDDASSADEPAGPIPANFGTPAPAGKKVESPNGSYTQSTITDDDPAMKLNPGLVDPSLQSTDPAELESAQKFIVKFAAEEGIDSRLNGDSADLDSWWNEHKSKVDPSGQESLYNAIKSGEPFVLTEPWQSEQYGDKYDYRTSPNKTRIYDREITPTTIWSPTPGTIAVQMNVSYKIPVKPNVGITGSGVQTTSGTMNYAVVKDNQGNWVINGFNNDIQTVQG